MLTVYASQALQTSTNDLLHELLQQNQIVIAMFLIGAFLFVVWQGLRIFGLVLNRQGKEKDASDKNQALLIGVVVETQNQIKETLDLLKAQTALNAERNATQQQQASDLASIAASNSEVAGVATRMETIVSGFLPMKDKAVDDLKAHASKQTEEVTNTMTAAVEKIMKRIDDVAEKVDAITGRLDADHDERARELKDIHDELLEIRKMGTDTGPLPPLPAERASTTEPLMPDKQAETPKEGT